MPVDLEGRGRAEDGQAVRVIRGAVDGIEDPAVARARGPASRILRRGWRDRETVPPISARNICSTCSSISVTRSIVPFFSMWRSPRRQSAWRRPHDRLDRGGEKDRGSAISHRSPASSPCGLPCRPRAPVRSCTSSMKLRMKKMPRPLDFSMFSGASGLATSLGIEPVPLVEDANDELARRVAGRERELDGDELGRDRSRLPCLMALMTDSRTATPIQWTASSSRPAIWPMRSLTTCTKSSMSKRLGICRRTRPPRVIMR